MSLRLEMLQVARLAPPVLGESASLVTAFVSRQQNPDGGFKDRKGESDLYYTAFALDCLAALQVQIPREPVRAYLLSVRPAALDFVHLCCLARCWAAITPADTDCEFLEIGDIIRAELHRFRTKNGGFGVKKGEKSGTSYGAFLAAGAFQDLRVPIPHREQLIASLEPLKKEGGWANEADLPVASTNATAAAITLLCQFGTPIESSAADWLLAQAHPGGGFRAAPRAPIPDLLSTATSLHALAAMERDFSHIKEKCLDFIDTLWTNEGSFHGHWDEELLDTEYTFYGLLALGHLSY